MLLEDKVAVVDGGGGNIGGAAARAFAREGASVFLAGRTASTLDHVAAEIRSNGGVSPLKACPLAVLLSCRSTARLMFA